MKKAFKKSLFLLLTLLSMFIIVACGEKLSKKEIVEKFAENSKNIKSTDLVMTMKIEEKKSTNSTGVSMEATADISVILEPTLAIKMNLVAPVANNKLSMYVKDGYSYVQNPGDGRWIKQSNRNFEEQFKKAYAQSNLIYEFSVKNLDKIDLNEKDGNYILSIKDFKKIFKNETSVLNPTGKGLDGFEDMIMSFTVDKKTFLPLNFIMTGAINEGALKIDFLFEAKYSNINNVKEIVIPKEVLETLEEKNN